MKQRILFALVAIWLATIPAMAQKGFNINRVFGGYYRDKQNATETLMKGSRLDDLKLDIYHSLVITDSPADAEKIEKLVTRDGTRASHKEQTFRKGRLYYGFYVYGNTDFYRYIFYLNKYLNGGNAVTLIYMEGEATPTDIQKMLK